ncbi:MAG TPA: EamA family transporter, partial [Methylophilaceae bacterium]|nr:EamA family transporter [Methylophilaceae bacterium]
GVMSAWGQLTEEPNTFELIGMALIAFALIVISIVTMRKHQPVDCAQGQE